MRKILGLILIVAFLTPFLSSSLTTKTQAQSTDTLLDDYTAYQQYKQYLDYDKKQKYAGYLRYKKVAKYRFKNESTRAKYQLMHDNYQLYLSDPVTNAQFKKLKKQYVRYENYLNKYLPLVQYSTFKSYKRYNKKKYNAGANYGTQEHLDGYNRYLAAQGGANMGLGEADLGGGALGPEIAIGLENYSRTYLKNNDFEITAKSASSGNPLSYNIKNESGDILATIAGNSTTKVNYTTNKIFSISNSIPTPITVSTEIRFEASDSANDTDIVFHFNRPSSSFDDFRSKIKLRYYDDPNPDNSDTIWAINTLPLEQYIWGMGEMAGTGPNNHSRVMTTVFRTYGYWKLKFSTKYALQRFKVNATPGNQLYYGYDWEVTHSGIRNAAEATAGKLVMYASSGKNEIALTPYSSWSDGRTRSFEERWGSKDYPWCKSVKDPYGKNSSKSTEVLESDGNHMVGLIANGSLKLAGDSYKWEWDRILRYYFTNINIIKAY
ncbi:MAG: hypothetical protein ACD_8C00050G0006 [uncultured bacterium]|nr:MAG: hypothetical protein ACD_8C00050G0006 [uncultured bacterium]